MWNDWRNWGGRYYLLNLPFGGGGASCGTGDSNGDDDGGGGNFICVSGAQGNLPKPGPNTQYSPGSIRVGGVCPFPLS